MKIIYIANIRIPTEKAHGIQIMKMCEAFSRQCSVELIVPTKKDVLNANKDPYSYYKVKKSFMVKKIWSLDPYWLMKLPQGIYIKFQSVFFVASLCIYLLLRRKDRDIILYTRDEYLLPFIQFFSKKVIWEAHTLPKNKKWYIKYWNRCHAIVAITEILKNELVENGIEKDKIIIARDGVDIKSFSMPMNKNECRKKIGLPENKKIIIYTGHLYDWKGAQTLADASVYLDESYHIVFVGGTKYDADKFIQANINKSNISIIGHIAYSEIPYYIIASDALIIPNSAKNKISVSYTSPLKFFEYLTSRKPIIASDIPSLHEIGEKFKGIFYFKADDPKNLSEIIKTLDMNATYMRDLREYSWEKRAENIIKFIYK
ncbi:MAG: Glycosyl transferase group 1 [Parcubacteria group bacterium GW2011_GWA2_38_13]|nr:MAG: Glycosyl transferase group 1 [Parcubacteria group bacterium GW2011_GWA2_38_13]